MSQGHQPPIRPNVYPGPSMEPIQAQVVPNQPGEQGAPFNPYEAPVAADLVGNAYRPPEQVAMPLSVVIAIVCICLVAAINGLNLFAQILARRVEWFAPSALTVSVLVLLGMFSRHRLAWQWGRVLCILGAILTTFLAVIGGITAIAVLNQGMNPRQFQMPPGVNPEQFGMIMVIGSGVLAFMAALQWTIVASLGFYSRANTSG